MKKYFVKSFKKTLDKSFLECYYRSKLKDEQKKIIGDGKMKKMNLEAIVKETRKNGGFSDEILLKKRFIVSMELEKETIINIKDFNEKSLRNAIKNFSFKLDQGLGTWLYNEQVFVDINQGFDTMEEALEIARRNNQLAIYDSIEGKEIKTGIIR